MLSCSYVRGLCWLNKPTASTSQVSAKQWFLCQTERWHHICETSSSRGAHVIACRQAHATGILCLFATPQQQCRGMTWNGLLRRSTDARSAAPSAPAQEDDEWYDEDLQAERDGSSSHDRQQATLPAGFELPKPTNVRLCSFHASCTT